MFLVIRFEDIFLGSSKDIVVLPVFELFFMIPGSKPNDSLQIKS